MRALLADQPIETAAVLVRAFSALLPPRQRRRAGAPGADLRDAAAGRRLAGPRGRRRSPSSSGPKASPTRWPALAVRPVFTAHPTEASRRSILTKLRRVADILASATRGRQRRTGPAGPRPRRTDRPDLADRRAAPAPARPGRRGAQRRLLPGGPRDRDRARAVRRPRPTRPPRHGVTVAADARPLTFGTWIGGDRDGNPNVTPTVTREVLRLQHHVAARIVDQRARRADRRAVVLDGGRAGVARELARVARGRPRRRRGRPAARHAERDRAVPAQAHLHQGEARQHPARLDDGMPHRPGLRLPRRPSSCSPSWR